MFQRRISEILSAVCAAGLIVITSGGVANAAELDWILDMSAMASDNIFREPVGSEIPGTLYQLMGGLQIEDVQGYNNYRFMGVAGRERIETDPHQEENPIYRLEADMSWTSRGGSYLQIIGNAYRLTNTLEPPDFNQLRSLEERVETLLITGKRYQSGGEWQGSIIGDRLDREDIIVKRIAIAANATVPINRSTNLNFEGLTRKGQGYEEILRDDWIEGFIDMEYLHRTARTLSFGSSFYWFSADTASSNNNINLQLNNFHLTGSLLTMEAVNLPLYVELGIDGINNFADEWDLDLYGDVSITVPLAKEVTNIGRRMVLIGQAAYQALVNRFNEMPVSIGRLGTLDATIVWRPVRTFEIDTGIVYEFRLFPDEELLPDRDEKRRTATIGTSWLISQGVNLRLAAILEQTDSELNTRDREENRIEMNFNGIF